MNLNAQLAQRAISLAEPLGGILGKGVAERIWARSLLALQPPRWAEAEAHLAASLQAFEAGECVVEAARTHVIWGQLSQARDELETAREHFVQAAGQFEASGLKRELEETSRLLVILFPQADRRVERFQN